MTANVRSESVCEGCGDRYYPTSNRQRFCKKCVPNKRARKNLLFYGITEKQFQAALAEADGHCPLCGKESDEDNRHHKLAVDHDHKTKKFRGMLCRNCNMGMGFVDNDEWLAKALEWRERGR